jgi:hypothetical protein
VLTDGRYLLHVNVAARTAAQAKTLGLTLAKKLDARLKLALLGRLHAKPVKLPPRRRAGRAAGGPHLPAMALAPTDLSGTATLGYEQYALPDLGRPWGYQPDSKALSTYIVSLGDWVGPLNVLYQDIEWFSTANEANFFADRFFETEDSQSSAVALDLSSLGDGARGVVPNDSRFPGEAFVIFSTGKLAEVLQVTSAPAPPQVSDITSVAQTAAHKINAAYSG